MLTRHIFRHLTDAILFDTSPRPLCLSPRNCLRLPPTPPPSHHSRHLPRHSSTSSSTRWKTRQTRDRFAREAKVAGLKSRAAFKLLEIDQRYKLFKPGQTVVDLGYAPGSWSQVAQAKTAPNGRVIGIDVLPVQPPRGVSTIQGNFLSEAVQREVRAYVQDPERGRLRRSIAPAAVAEDEEGDTEGLLLQSEDGIILEEERGYIDMERHADLDFTNEASIPTNPAAPPARPLSQRDRDLASGRVVDVLLSDMSAPWDQTTGMWSKSISNAYHRMQNTSGIPFKDHAGSMDLCLAALTFGYDTLRTGGVFVCKFYQGKEDKVLEGRLRALFERVVREKPESSRSESKEAYFIGLRRKENVQREAVLAQE